MSIRPLVSVSLAVETSKRQALVDALQALGVAHIRPLTLGGQDESDAKPVIDPEQLTQALRYLEGAAHKRRQQELLPSEVNERLIDILKHQIQRSALKARLDFLNQRIKSLAPWGDFEWPPLEALSGYRLWFYRIPARQMKHLETLELPWQEVHRTPDLHYIVVLSKDEPDEHALPVPRTHTGPVRLSELKAEKEQCLDQLEQMDAERSSLTRWYDALQNTRSRIQDDAQKAAVLKHSLNRSGFTGLSFWMDPLHANALSPLCDHFNAACVVSDVKASDHPPTLLSNPHFFAGGQAAVQFFQTPGYRSWDPSRVVFFSFALFFALIVSDFGYAAVMAACLGLFTPRLQQSEKSRRMLGLLWVMIVMAMVWGVLVGSYFGYEPQDGVLDTLHVMDLHDFNSMMRYRIGIDTQQERCLPDTTVYLIDLWNKELVKDGLYAFHSKGLAPLYNDGTRMLKRLTGMPGDEVKVTPEHVLVNGTEVSTGMALAQRLGVAETEFSRSLTLQENEYWFSGEAATSFDSRYWNAVKREQIVGRAWPLW
jgi:V/A-type H+-transporting ATPase subunit I